MQNPLQWFFIKKSQSLPQEPIVNRDVNRIDVPIRKSPTKNR